MTSTCVCIPTYQRPALLEALLQDLARQTAAVERLVVVDGDPGSGAVAAVLERMHPWFAAEVVYVPSNHGNLSYQRYLAWRAAQGCDAILYLDDDIRIAQPDAVERVIEPLFWTDRRVAGVTGHIEFGDVAAVSGEGALLDRQRHDRKRASALVRWLGTGAEPGGLTPAGHRRLPESTGSGYEPVQWLHGGVMAYRMDALTAGCFSTDLFALDHVRCGKGEDTFLSRRAGTRGELLRASCAVFQHPEADLPKAYPTAAFKLGYSTAYSRRFLNDHFRPFARPTPGDRLALARSYVGTAALAWARALRAPRGHRFAYALGYTRGAVQGALVRPRATSLTPQIDWWGAADEAMRDAVRISPRGTSR